MNTTFIYGFIASVIGLAFGVGECFLLLSIINTITQNKGIPIFRMLCFVGSPLAMLAIIIYFLDPMSCIWGGVAITIGLIITALINYSRLRR